MYVYRLSHLIYLQTKKNNHRNLALVLLFFFFDCPRLPPHHLTIVSLPCSSLSSPTFFPLFHILLSLRRICAGTRVARPEKNLHAQNCHHPRNIFSEPVWIMAWGQPSLKHRRGVKKGAKDQNQHCSRGHCFTWLLRVSYHSDSRIN